MFPDLSFSIILGQSCPYALTVLFHKNIFWILKVMCYIKKTGTLYIGSQFNQVSLKLILGSCFCTGFSHHYSLLLVQMYFRIINMLHVIYSRQEGAGR